MANKKHAVLIREWLNGEKIQWRHNGTPWRDCDDDNPEWSPLIEYRIKPAEPEREYPESKLSGYEMGKAYNDSNGMIGIANAALRHAIDHGQVVPRAEFDRAIGHRAARDMAVAEAVMLACHDCANPQSNIALRISKVNLLQVIQSIK